MKTKLSPEILDKFNELMTSIWALGNQIEHQRGTIRSDNAMNLYRFVTIAYKHLYETSQALCGETVLSNDFIQANPLLALKYYKLELDTHILKGKVDKLFAIRNIQEHDLEPDIHERYHIPMDTKSEILMVQHMTAMVYMNSHTIEDPELKHSVTEAIYDINLNVDKVLSQY